ncbi:TIM barrel protein [Streptomyces sp. CLV115]|uniref:hydroxypyruvate isomerase family protein n=1 Tax=Streptomyces sp. CLV115 TaxID=3138502 RepID=UPI00313B9EC4
MTHTWAVNCSIMLKDRPIEERLAAVVEAGFEAVEFWWPFDSAAPDKEQIDAFASVIERSRLELTALNLYAGDMAAGDRGIVSWPEREAELRSSTDVAARIGERLGTRRFNALYGNRIDGERADAQDALAVDNLRRSADRVAEIGGVLLIEPVSGADRYPLRTADDAVSVIDRVQAAGAENIRLLLDVYHLAVNGDDVSAAIRRHAHRIGHVQLADAPGRGAPGTGGLPVGRWVRELRDAGYDDRIAFEYVSEDEDPLAALGDGFRKEER